MLHMAAARLAWLSWGGAPGLCQWSRQAAPSGGPMGGSRQGESYQGVPSGGPLRRWPSRLQPVARAGTRPRGLPRPGPLS